MINDQNSKIPIRHETRRLITAQSIDEIDNTKGPILPEAPQADGGETRGGRGLHSRGAPPPRVVAPVPGRGSHPDRDAGGFADSWRVVEKQRFSGNRGVFREILAVGIFRYVTCAGKILGNSENSEELWWFFLWSWFTLFVDWCMSIVKVSILTFLMIIRWFITMLIIRSTFLLSNEGLGSK